MPDETINCSDCRQPFTHSVRDQEFYAKQGYSPPKRCKPCRDARKAQKEQSGGSTERR